jgi:hypothetical protein
LKLLQGHHLNLSQGLGYQNLRIIFNDNSHVGINRLFLGLNQGARPTGKRLKKNVPDLKFKGAQVQRQKNKKNYMHHNNKPF